MKDQSLFIILFLSLVYLGISIYSFYDNNQNNNNEKYTQMVSRLGGAYFNKVPRNLGESTLFTGFYGASGYYRNVPDPSPMSIAEQLNLKNS